MAKQEWEFLLVKERNEVIQQPRPQITVKYESTENNTKVTWKKKSSQEKSPSNKFHAPTRKYYLIHF